MKTLRAAAVCLTTVWLCICPLLVISQSPPRLLPQAYDLERVVPEGTNVQLPCPVEASDPDTLFFEWFRDKEVVSVTFREDRFRISPSGILKIKAASPEDTGRYVCRAVNGFGRVDINVTLIVLSSPETIRPATSEEDEYSDFDPVETEGGDFDVGDDSGRPRFISKSKFPNYLVQRPVGSSIRFKCNATGFPRPQITWLKNGKPLPDNKKSRWTLQLQNLQPSDTGNYTCLVYNGFGSISSVFHILVTDYVRGKPEMTGSHPLNITVPYGGIAEFQCRVRSDVPPHVQWLKRIEAGNLNADIDPPNTIKVQGEFLQVLESTDVMELSDGSFLNKLVIYSVKEQDSGKYICMGANTMGYSYRSAFLTVHRQSRGNSTTPSFNLPFPIVAAIAVAGAILLAALVALLFYCRSRRPTPTPRGQSSKSSVSTETKHTYVGMAYNPEYSAVKGEMAQGPPARVYLPSDQLHGAVPLNSIFL